MVDNWENLIEDEILIEIIKFTVHYDPEKRLSADEIYGRLDSIIKKKGWFDYILDFYIMHF